MERQPGGDSQSQPAIKVLEMVQDGLFERGTGTDGPAPRRAPSKLQVVKRPPGPVSYKVALRQITGEVLQVLKENGEQWESGPRQDLISTVFIAAARQKAVTFNFEPESAK